MSINVAKGTKPGEPTEYKTPTKAQQDQRAADDAKHLADLKPAPMPPNITETIATAFGQLPVADQKVLLPLLTANKLALDYGNIDLVASNLSDFTPVGEAQIAFINGVKQALGIK